MASFRRKIQIDLFLLLKINLKKNLNKMDLPKIEYNRRLIEKKKDDESEVKMNVNCLGVYIVLYTLRFLF